jgi:hypothetical protein
MKTILILLLIFTTAAFFVNATGFDCIGKIIITNIAMKQLPSVEQAKLQNAIDYQLMSTGLSSITELPCWNTNISSILQLSNPNISHDENQYSNWNSQIHCFAPLAEVQCPPSWNPSGVLPDALQSATDALKCAFEDCLLSGANTDATIGFWLGAIAEMVSSAHNPLSVCSLFDDEFPNGDDSGKKFFVKFQNGQRETSLNDFINSVGGVFYDFKIEHPLEDFPDQVERIDFFSKSLEQELAKTITPSQSTDLNFQNWISESFNLCQSVVYKNRPLTTLLKNGTSLNTPYILEVRNKIQRQLLLGGYRLANLLLSVMQDKK